MMYQKQKDNSNLIQSVRKFSMTWKMIVITTWTSICDMNIVWYQNKLLEPFKIISSWQVIEDYLKVKEQCHKNYKQNRRIVTMVQTTFNGGKVSTTKYKYKEP